MTGSGTRSRIRVVGEHAGQVTTVELFFDLVYVFAVTQLSHLLVNHPTFAGAVHSAVVLAMVWQVWVYTTWSLNYLDPAATSVRLMLLAATAASLVLASALPEAFAAEPGQSQALLLAGAYVAIQVGRAVFEIWALRGSGLQIIFVRVLPWSCATGALVLVGGFVDSPGLRTGLWALAVAVDLSAAATGFWLPRIGRSATREWTISGSHFAERCQAFVLIALGESVVVIGERAHLFHGSAADLGSFALCFVGVVTLWWIYFDRSAEDSTEVISRAADPGRLARNAFHFVHPIIVAGIIVTAAADESALEHLTATAHGGAAWFPLVGTALFLAGHAIFKAVVWHVVSWQRVIGVLVLLALTPVAHHLTVGTLCGIALAVGVGVAIADRFAGRHVPASTAVQG